MNAQTSDKLELNDEERRRIFYMLKKNSSYTAWARVGEYLKNWLAIYQEAIADADAKGLNWFRNRNRDIINTLGIDECLDRLRKGNKRPFKYLGQRGYFYQAFLATNSLSRKLMYVWGGDMVMEEVESPYWEKILESMYAAGRAKTEVGYFILEREYTDDPAPFAYWHLENRGPNFLKEYCAFPDGELPPVPEPTENIFLRSGEYTPYSGIWEPVKLDYSKGVLGLFQKPFLPTNGKFDLDGPMNYLHVGSPAPTLAFPEDEHSGNGRPTTWRLIWRDDRYTDGSIPEEEKEYTFRCPEYPHTPWEEFLNPELKESKTAQSATESTVNESRCPALQPCPREGYWFTPARENSRRHFVFGEIMPDVGGSYGATIWQFDGFQ